MQQLDDVTGDVIRLSAADKERRMQTTVATLNAVILQVNELTKAVRELRETCALATERMDRIDTRHYEHSQAVVQMFYGRTLLQRLRWIATGR